MIELFYAFAAKGLCSLIFSQDTIPLLCGSDSIKVHQKSDNLMIRFIVKVSGEMHFNPTEFISTSMAIS